VAETPLRLRKGIPPNWHYTALAIGKLQAPNSIPSQLPRRSAREFISGHTYP